jgi:hypothetical protein
MNQSVKNFTLSRPVSVVGFFDVWGFDLKRQQPSNAIPKRDTQVEDVTLRTDNLPRANLRRLLSCHGSPKSDIRRRVTFGPDFDVTLR